MKASEIVNEGPADWLGDKLDAGRAQTKAEQRAKTMKQNVPKITKILQQQLASKVKGTDPKSMDSVIAQVLSKALKTNVTRADFATDMNALYSAIKQNPTGITNDPNVQTAISKVVTTSVGIDSSFAETDEKLVARLAAAVKNMQPEEQRKYIEAYGIKIGYNKRKAEQLANEVLGTSNQGNPRGTDVIAAAIKKEILANQASYANRDDAAEFIQHNLERNGVTDDIEIADASDKLMQDPDMPFNYKPDDEFRGLVYSPNGPRYIKGRDEDNVGFVKHKGKWASWIIGPNGTWKYQELVTDNNQARYLESLAKQASNEVLPLMFRNHDVEGSTGMYKVSST